MLIPLSKPNIGEEEKEAVLKVLESGWWTMGSVTEQLEEEFAEYKGCQHAIAVNSCSSALIIAVAEFFKGSYMCDKVLTPTMSFCATTNSLIHNDIYPVFVDSKKHSPQLDIDSAAYWFDKVDGVVPVDFGGWRCDRKKIKKYADKFGWVVVFDSAHAVEGKEDCVGDASCYSFNPIKNLAAPEMGMICTNNSGAAKRMRQVRMHGMTTDAHNRIDKPGQYDIDRLGYKMNCTDVESAVALCQLRKLDENLVRRLEIVGHYTDNIKHDYFFDGVHLFQMIIKNRNEFVMNMRDRGICCGIHYKPIHLHSYYQKEFGTRPDMYINAERIGRDTVSLPLGPGMTDEEVEYVIENVNDYLKNT